jgi:maltokinase
VTVAEEDALGRPPGEDEVARARPRPPVVEEVAPGRPPVVEEVALGRPPVVEEVALRPSRNHLQLDATHAIRVVATETGHRAEPVTAVGDAWARSTAGDGAGSAVLHRLRTRTAVEEGFRVTAAAPMAVDDESELAMGVDQTNESWVVGGRVVVKWVTDDLGGPHAAAERMRRLAEAGFARTPTLVGLLEWQNPGGHWAPVAVVQEFLQGAEDGWTWTVDEARRALGVVPGEPTDFAGDLGDLTARMHLALADGLVGATTPEQARAQADDSRAVLDEAIRLTSAFDPDSHRLLVAQRARIAADLAALDHLAGSPAFPLHGDFHVGQVLRTPDGGLHVVDFDGNPTRPSDLRVAPGPAARDVAGMLVALENVAHVVRHYAPEVEAAAAGTWVRGVQRQFLAAYVAGLGPRRDLYDEGLVPAFDWEQVCREFVYAARHLPRWGYVPAAALRLRVLEG